MVSGYFSGSTSTSARASGVTQPAHTFTRGKTAASSNRVRTPARASRHAAVLPPGPPPTTMTSWAATSAPPELDIEPQSFAQWQPDVLHRVGDLHAGKQIALDVDGALDVGLGEVERGRLAHEADERVRPVHDRRAHRRAVAQFDQRSVPEPEGAPGLQLIEDPSQDSRRSSGADVSWQRNHEVVMGSTSETLAECPDGGKKSRRDAEIWLCYTAFSSTAWAAAERPAGPVAAVDGSIRIRRMSGRSSGTAANIAARSQKSSA